MPGAWIGLVVGSLKDGKQADLGEDAESGGGDKKGVRDQGRESLSGVSWPPEEVLMPQRLMGNVVPGPEHWPGNRKGSREMAV